MRHTFKNPLVVGYKGEIGSFILQGLLRVLPKATNIWCFDVNDKIEDMQYRIKKADYIFLCNPIQETVNWLFSWFDELRNKIIIEQTSLKLPIFEEIKDSNVLRELDIRSMHILFRPSSTSFNDKKNRKCLIYQGQWMPHDEQFLGEITNSTLIKLEDHVMHDVLMAKEQALIHRTLLALRKVINDQSYVTTYISNHIRELTDRILEGDPQLYEYIQTNKFLKTCVDSLKIELGNINIKEEIEYNKSPKFGDGNEN